jgi:acyl-CoA synthetase (NDP forming)
VFVISADAQSVAGLIASARAQGRQALDEAAGKKVLGYFNISVPRGILVRDSNAIAGAVAALNPPYAVKVVSPDILHKSDTGGVTIGLAGMTEVAHAITAMSENPRLANARLDGWLIEEMAPPGREIVIGGVRDPNFGQLVMVGLGGIFVEVLADVAFRICPITRLDAEEMIAELKGSAILKGIRGANAVSQEAIVDALLKVGGTRGLLTEHSSDFSAIDINPLIVSARGAVAVDARFVLT